ncbi:MAG: succinylglutamate desuccinylase/aspartoacylase family protein [Alcanivoracaceae bacterium]|nr:succinylglutamate desuccinylase/aspartoacylase family protein [Alcanivoracaceae bacterium]
MPAIVHRLLLLALFAAYQPLLATETEDEEDAAPAPISERLEQDSDTQVAQPATSTTPPEHTPTAFTLLDSNVEPGSFNTLLWRAEQSFASIATPVPVLVAHGARTGPVLCLTAAVHGDEINGIEMVRHLMFDIEPQQLAGTVIGVPIVNLDGFRRGERYLSDRRDLNRHFPGNASGSAASRVAHSLFGNVVRHCDYLVDLHTGSLARTNLPQIRGDLKNPDVVTLARHLGGITVLDGRGAKGTLRRAATDAGIPTLTLEAGGPHILEQSAVDIGVKALRTLLDNLDMHSSGSFWDAPQPVFYESEWVRSSQGGILLSKVKLGERVRTGQVLGTVVDPVTNTGSAILAPFDGRILGMAENQVVQTGYATYHVGVEKAAEKIEEEAQQATPDDVSTSTPENNADQSLATSSSP